LLGTAAWGLTTLGSYIADNLSRQKEEQEKKGKKYEDVNRMTATAAATGQTALDAFGFSYFKPLGRLVGFSGKESAEQATKEIVQAATDPRAYRKAVASGVAKGIAFEVPQEVTQSVLERWQAGLALNPFTDPEAAKEYLEAAGGALLLGGPMGAYSGAVNTYRARQTPEGQVALRSSQSGAALDIEGEGNVDQSISAPGGAGISVAGQPNTGAPAGGTSVAQPAGVDAAGQNAAGLASGTANAPGALNEPPGLMDGMPGDGTPAETVPPLAPQNVDEYAARAQQGLTDANANQRNTDPMSAKYGNEDFAPASNLQEPPGLMDAPADTEEISSAPSQTVAEAVQDPAGLARLRDNYVAIKEELDPIYGRGDPKKSAALVRSLQRMVDESASLIQNQELIKNLKNPMFNGKGPLDKLAQDAEVASDPKAMQSNLFGKFINGARAAQLAVSYTGSTQAAIKFLQDKKQRLQNDLASGKLDRAWAQKIGARYGMTQGESVNNFQKVAELYTQSAVAEVDAALNQLSQQKSTPKAMQSDMFGEGQSKDEKVKPIAADAETTDMFGADKTPDIGNRDEPLTFENQEAFEAYQNRLKRSAAGEKRNQAQAGVASPSMTPFQRELAGVRKDLEAAKVEAAANKEAPAPAAPKAAPEQVDMFGKPVAEKKQKEEKSKVRETIAVLNQLVGTKKRKPPTSIAEDFEEFGAETAEDEKSEAETQREAQEKEAEQKAAEAKKDEEDKKAPKVGTEHVQTTEEGKAIKSFFDAIKPAARPGSDEATKIADEKRKIVELLTEFDITKPGERTSAGIKAAYKFFTDLMGGEAKFKILLNSLQKPSNMSDAQKLGQANLPNLTTRRGLETLKDQVEAYINSLGAKGPKIKIEPGKVAYETDVEVVTKRAMTPGTTPEGKIRRPSMEGGTKQFKVSDTKLRGAWTKLKQMFDSSGNVTPEMLAAKAYITNPTRSKFGFVLADLAQDLALYDMYLEAKYGMRAADIKELTAEERQKLPQTAEQKKVKSDGVGANSTFYGEGGIYAERFQRWIEQNLDPKTIATLNQMVENERSNIEEELKFNKAVTIFNLEVQKRKTASAQSRIAAAEKATKKELKVKKAKEAKETAAAVEGIETEGDEKIEDAPVEFINRPEKQKLHAAVVRTLQDGDLKGALKILANEKGNGYFKNLAARLLEAGLTAKSKVLPQNTIESLENDPKIKETLDNQLRALRDMVETSLPEAQRGELLSALSSKSLFDVNAGVAELKDVLTNEAQMRSTTLKPTR